jgi:hypothetical protein
VNDGVRGGVREPVRVRVRVLDAGRLRDRLADALRLRDGGADCDAADVPVREREPVPDADSETVLAADSVAVPVCDGEPVSVRLPLTLRLRVGVPVGGRVADAVDVGTVGDGDALTLPVPVLVPVVDGDGDAVTLPVADGEPEDVCDALLLPVPEAVMDDDALPVVLLVLEVVLVEGGVGVTETMEPLDCWRRARDTNPSARADDDGHPPLATSQLSTRRRRPAAMKLLRPIPVTLPAK